jgi:glutaredoxin 2
MKIKQVYISDENFERLKEINASNLINNLLTDYFKTTGSSKEDLIKKKEQMMKEIEDEFKRKEEMINKVETQIEAVETKEVQEKTALEIADQKQRDKLQNIVTSAKDIYEVEISQETAQEFLNGEWTSLQDFLEDMNFIKRDDTEETEN